MAKSVGMLWKLRKFLPKKTLISLYHAFVHSQLLYGIVTWGPSVLSNNLNQLQLLQNNSIRAIVGMKKSQHITSFYRDLEILKIKDLCNFEIAKLMFLYHYSRLPIMFNNYFLTSAAVNNYYTRSYHSLKYYIPKYRLVRLQKSFNYTGVKIWNNIDLNTKLLSFNKFKENYKKQLLLQY